MSSQIHNSQVDRIRVGGATPYEVLIGRDLLGALPGLLGDGVRRVLVLHPQPLADKAARVARVLGTAGYDVFLEAVPDAEAQKTIEVVAQVWARLGRLEFTRTDAIVAVGGGATTDLGGFIAATWLRGIKVIHVSTSILGMVDAAVGGKTGINTAEGKNLVGSFYAPDGVLCDLSMLETLPQRDFVAGLAEVVKTGFIADPVILDLVQTHAAELRRWPESANDELWEVIAGLVARSVAVKARVVSEDMTEKGPREFLNYGHTFGHAVELAQGFRWRHGEAVSVGMVFCAELAVADGIASTQLRQLHYDVLGALGLPTRYELDGGDGSEPAGASPGGSADAADEQWQQLLTAMRRDKKTRGAMLRFIVLPQVGQPARLEGPSLKLLREVFDTVTVAQ